MPRTPDPFRLLLFAVAGWMNHRQQQIIDYLREENRILHAQLGTRRLRFDNEQRRRLAGRAKLLAGRFLGLSVAKVAPAALIERGKLLRSPEFPAIGPPKMKTGVFQQPLGP